MALYEIYFQSCLSNNSNSRSHYASANQNEFKINAEIIDYDPSKKIISLDGAISMTSDDFQISGTTATISMNEEVISIREIPQE